jgi:CubicO group peptidase (beta-lactamase class C family)
LTNNRTTSGCISEQNLTAFNVPGIAVAIIKDGKVVLAKGYGVKSIETKEKWMPYTFGIASNSKAFTSASLAILVDEGKIKWDDKVNTYLILKCTMITLPRNLPFVIF